MLRTRLFIFQLLLLMSGMSLIMVLLKGSFGNAFGVYKETCCLLIIVFGIYKIRLVKHSLFFILTFMLIALLSINLTHLLNPQEPFFYLYQFKIEFFYVLLFLMLLILTSNKGETYQSYKKFEKIVLFLAVVNVFSAIAQRLFFGLLSSSLGYSETNVFNSDFNNVVIQTQGGAFRTIGTFSSPMALAEFLAFCLAFCTLKVRSFFRKSIFVIFCVIAIYFTGYKTTWTYIPALLFFIYAPKRYHEKLALSYSVLLITAGFAATHFEFVYDFVKKISPLYAEFSLKLRMDYIDVVFTQMTGIPQILFGVGYGVNGGLYEYLPGTVPLDSFYIYIISNYGFLPLFCIFVWSIVQFTVKNNQTVPAKTYDAFYTVRNYLIVMLAGNFFWNNPLVNYPSLFFPIVAFYLLLKKKKYERYIVDNAT